MGEEDPSIRSQQGRALSLRQKGKIGQVLQGQPITHIAQPQHLAQEEAEKLAWELTTSYYRETRTSLGILVLTPGISPVLNGREKKQESFFKEIKQTEVMSPKVAFQVMLFSGLP